MFCLHEHPSPSVILIWLVIVILRLDIILDRLRLMMLHLAPREVHSRSGRVAKEKKPFILSPFSSLSGHYILPMSEQCPQLLMLMFIGGGITRFIWV